MGMFRIGEFSKITKVTIDTLRHYDTLGLLKPAKVDPFTGYRYYSARQLQTLNRILALKESGFSLEEIARILEDKPTDEQLYGMLKAQLVRIERDLQTAQTRRERILARLNYLQLEEDMPAYEVTVKPGEALTVAAIRDVVPSIDQMPQRCTQMFDTIDRWVKTNHIPVGPTMTVYYNEGFSRENIDTECAYIIMNPTAVNGTTPDKPVEIKQMEAVPLLAYTVVTDDFYKKVDGLTPAYNALARWIEENNYQIVGPPRELFYGSPQGGDLTAEVQFPVAKI